MTVFHLISSEGYYGAEAVVVELASQAAKLGCRIVVGAFRDNRKAHTEVADRAGLRGLAVETIPCRGRWDRRATARLRELLHQHAADVLHTHGYKADFYGCLAARAPGTALVATCHNWPSRQPVMRAYGALDRRILRRFDEVVAVSDSVAEKLRRSGFPEAKLTMIPNGVDIGRFAQAQPTLRLAHLRGRRVVVGFVARLVENKGGAILLRAARRVIDSRPDTAFVFAGEGPQRGEWQGLAVGLGLAGAVSFLGARPDMPGIYASLDVLVLPSLEEATPLCVLEAMAAGVPVIATRVGGVPKLILSGVTGILTDPGNEAELAEAILHVINDPAFARRIAVNARCYVSAEFSAQRMAARYLELYRRAAGEAARPVEAGARQVVVR